MTKDQSKLEVGLLDNACHSLIRGFEFLGVSIDKQDKLLLKDAVVWIHHGIELSLKQLLVQKNEFLVFDNIDKAVQKLGTLRRKKGSLIEVLELFDYGETSYTVGYGKAVERVSIMLNLQELAQGESLREQLDKLTNSRNRIVHFLINIYTDEITDMLVQLMHPFLNLLKREVKDEKFVNECIPEILKNVNAADYFINKRIKALSYDKKTFIERQKERSASIDLTKTSFENKVIAFKDGFAQTEYSAYRKLLEETSRAFRDFPDLEKIKVQIESHYEQKVYSCEIEIETLENFIGVKFEKLHQSIKNWRIFLGSINKSIVKDFAEKYISYEPLET
ncbi:MAG: hypothetical protein KDJ65_22310 [Anaerolineae bacterium]|nr:hypothetical protein [Anaerolineae bacterium]